MKAIVRYLKKRGKAIRYLVKQPQDAARKATFHQLRVEIKKLQAHLGLIRYCAKGFHPKKIFKPYQVVFRQAGKVRELQVEKAMLRQYIRADLLTDYRSSLQEKIGKEKESYFELINNKLIKGLKKSLRKIIVYATKINSKKWANYARKRQKRIRDIVKKQRRENSNFHQLRKHLQQFAYLQEATGFSGNIQLNRNKNDLRVLLGKWHDYQIATRHLKKAVRHGGVSSGEKRQLKKVKQQVSANRKLLVHRIDAVIPKSTFYWSSK
jgi:CHAD domain-containing protein